MMNYELPLDLSPAAVALHSTEEDLWVVADGFVVDISSFVQRHPGGAKTIREACATSAGSSSSSSSSFSFSSHFRHTQLHFQRACLRGEEEGFPVTLTFERSRANGGLDRGGSPTEVVGTASVGDVVILGYLAV
jgi:hypothetical protein